LETAGKWSHNGFDVRRKVKREMKTVATILIMLLTMPISYAMLDEAVRKMRIRDRIEHNIVGEAK
jgi:hypothetical protein